MVDEDWCWATFGRFSGKMKSFVLIDELTGGEEREKLKDNRPQDLYLHSFGWCADVYEKVKQRTIIHRF